MLVQLWQRLRGGFGPQQRPGAKILMIRGSRMAGELVKILRRYRMNIDLVEPASLL